MANIYSNENVPPQVVQELRRLGHDVLTSFDAGNANRAIPDEDVLDFAISQNRTLLTLNRNHFIKLHKIRPQHKGIIVCSFNPDFVALAKRIHEELGRFEVPSIVIRVNLPN